MAEHHSWPRFCAALLGEATVGRGVLSPIATSTEELGEPNTAKAPAHGERGPSSDRRTGPRRGYLTTAAVAVEVRVAVVYAVFFPVTVTVIDFPTVALVGL